MSAPRGLTPEEAALWARLAATVRPMPGRKMPQAPKAKDVPPASSPARGSGTGAAQAKPASAPVQPPPPAAKGLDSHWERKLKSGGVSPDLTLDLHGHNLDMAYDRLMGGMAQARAMHARIVLVIAGKPRHAPAADRAGQRGAIRAKLLDWLAASSHHSAIAAIRRAHLRHGGEGALYVVLKRER